jgi:hypothetical protein
LNIFNFAIPVFHQVQKINLIINVGFISFHLLKPCFVKRLKEFNMCCCRYDTEMRELKNQFNSMRYCATHVDYTSHCSEVCKVVFIWWSRWGTWIFKQCIYIQRCYWYVAKSGLCKAKISGVACLTMCERQMLKLWFETFESLPHGDWCKSFFNVAFEMLPRGIY